EPGSDALGRGERFLLAVAKRDQRVHDVAAALASRDERRLLQLVLQLEQQPLGGLLADAGDAREPTLLLQRDRLREIGDREAREHRERGARADAGDADELTEDAALLQRGEAVERM